jgi:transcriptional regulator with XRE-family HTH domain
MEKLGLTQAELARRVEVTQGAIAKIANNNPNGSSHLHKIARELQTTPDYLTGVSDDPDEDAPPPPARPTVQIPRCRFCFLISVRWSACFSAF